MERNESVELKRIFNIVKAKKILILVILIAFILLGYAYSYKYIVPEYKSTSTLLLIPNDNSENKGVTNTDLTLNSELISTYANIAKQSRVLKQVINNLELNMTEEELINKLEVNFTKDTYIIEIAVKNTNAKKAMDIASELSNVFLKEIKDIYNLNNIGIIDAAQLPKEPYNINHKKDIIIFFGIGIIASSICIVGIYVMDNTIKVEEDIEEYIKIKSLGRIPLNTNKKHEIVSKTDAKSYITECINTIRTNILYMSQSKGAKTVLVTSCKAEEGKSWVCANIATSFAEINKKVLLIDADMRKGRANKIFNVRNTEGLSNYLYNMTGSIKKDLELSKEYIKETDIANLHIITNGTIPPNPSELLDSDNMKELIYILKNMYDVIIVDAPPCMLVTDSIILSTIIDSTILVVNSEKTKIKDLQQVKKSIQIVGGKIIGAILNKVKVSGKIYSKSYYYGNTKKEDKCEIKPKEKITLDEIIEQASKKIEANHYNNLLKDAKKDEEKKENVNSEVKNDPNLEYNKEQKNYLEEIIGTVSDIKEELRSNNLENKLNSKNSEIQIKEFIFNKLEELEKRNSEQIKEELSNIKLQFNNLENSESFSEIFNELNNIKENLKDTKQTNKIEEEIQNIKLQFENINNCKLVKISNELEEFKLNYENSSNYLDEITRISEEVKEIYRQMMEYAKYTTYITSAMDTIKQQTLTKAQIQDIIKQEIANINYTNQISEINNILVNLKNNYLELSSKVEANNDDEKEIYSKNIIDIKELKQQRHSKEKKKEFLLKEDISYEELEKTAFCIIPFPKKTAIPEEYDNMTAVK